MLKRVLAMTLVSLFVNSAAFALPDPPGSKSDKQEQLVERVRLGIARIGIGKEAVVEVRLRDRSKLNGYISQSDQNQFVVTNEKTRVAVPVDYKDVVKVNGHNLSTGAKIGIGIAIGFALTVLVIFLIKG